jgi:hypothetical protein
MQEELEEISLSDTEVLSLAGLYYNTVYFIDLKHSIAGGVDSSLST